MTEQYDAHVKAYHAHQQQEAAIGLATKRLPVGWEIVRREDLRDGSDRIPAWATEAFYVLDRRTDAVAGGATPMAAARKAEGRS